LGENKGRRKGREKERARGKEWESKRK